MLWRAATWGAALRCGVSAASGASPENASKQAARLADDVCSPCHRPANKVSEPLVPILAGHQKVSFVCHFGPYNLAFRDDTMAPDTTRSPASASE